MSERITPEKILAWMHCPKGALSGYVPERPLGRPATGEMVQRALEGDGEARKKLRRMTTDLKETLAWLAQTDLYAMQSQSSRFRPPPPAEGPGQWIPIEGGFRGLLEKELVTGSRMIEIEIPAIQRVHGVYEAVYIDDRLEPPSMKRWKDVVTWMGIHREVFREITRSPLYCRYLAPGPEIERRVDVPEQNLTGLLNVVDIAGLTDAIRPGPHCEETVREGNSVRYRCPLREKGVCNPFRGGL